MIKQNGKVIDKEKVRELCQDFKEDNSSRYFYLYFLLRRAIFVISIILFRDFLVMQLALFSVGSYATLCYLLLSRPYKAEFLNTVEIFNEFCTLGISYLLFVFSDYQDDPYLKYKAGWMFSSTFFLILLFNAGFMLYFSVISVVYEKFCRKGTN